MLNVSNADFIEIILVLEIILVFSGFIVKTWVKFTKRWYELFLYKFLGIHMKVSL